MNLARNQKDLDSNQLSEPDPPLNTFRTCIERCYAFFIAPAIALIIKYLLINTYPSTIKR